MRTIGLLDANRPRRADAVAVQEQHEITFCSAEPAVIRSARLGPIPALLAQAMRLLLDDLEHGFPSGARQRRRVDRPHAADHREAEIFLDPLDRPRCCSLEERGYELDTIRAVIDPSPDRRTN